MLLFIFFDCLLVILDAKIQNKIRTISLRPSFFSQRWLKSTIWQCLMHAIHEKKFFVFQYNHQVVERLVVYLHVRHQHHLQ